jgi:hypothetical protein
MQPRPVVVPPLLAVGALALLLAALPAAAQVHDPGVAPDPGTQPPDAPPREDAERLVVMLSHYHEMPTRAALEAAFGDPVPLLRALRDNPDALLWHRDRALFALAAWGDEELRTWVRRVLDQPPADHPMLPHHALTVLGLAWGEDALDDLTPWLDHSDVQLRLTAVTTMESIGTRAAIDRLARRLARETHPLVIEAIQAAAARTP